MDRCWRPPAWRAPGCTRRWWGWAPRLKPPPTGAPPLVLLHWGDQKEGKGRAEALAVLQALLERAEAANLGLVWLQGEVDSAAMGAWLARCPIALLAYDPLRYAERSSGWLAAEAAALGVGWHSPEGSFGAWCARQLGNQVGPRLDVGNTRSEPRRPTPAGG